MQKKICNVMTILVAVSLAAFSLIMGRISYGIYKGVAEKELQSVANIIIATINEQTTLEDIDRQLSESLSYDVRLTYIDEEGNVLYDNEIDKHEMENHIDRQEIQDAFKNGTGESSRFSETIDKTVYYYAVKYGEGVLRFSRERDSLFSIFVVVIPILLSVAGGIFLVTTIISIKLSESLIRPINKLVTQFDIHQDGFDNIDNPYEELTPIIKSADVLLRRISRNMEKLKKEKQKITLITENMVEGMILLDSDKTVLSVNHSALKLLNPYFDAKSNEKLSHLTTHPQLMDLLDKLEDNKSVHGVLEIRNRFFRTFINKAEYNDQYGIIILLVDVTESIKSEQIRRDFSANVSHELKTPLTTIKGFGEMMDNGIITSPKEIKRYGGTIYREAERLLFLINDIIRLSEIEEKASSVTEEVDLLATATDVDEILQNKAYNQKIAIFINGDHVYINGNQSYITELLLNLMDNAVKYNNKGGSVWVEISQDDENAIVCVRDNGIGIEKDDEERVFERFYRVDKSRSKQIGGTGLGLSIVKHIVAYHDGEIKMQSELGKGTEIKIYLPLPSDDDFDDSDMQMISN